MKRLMREAYRLNKHRYCERLQRAASNVPGCSSTKAGHSRLPWEVTQQKISRSLDRWMKEHG